MNEKEEVLCLYNHLTLLNNNNNSNHNRETAKKEKKLLQVYKYHTASNIPFD